MPTDFFGCLHTEEVRGHKVRVFNPFLKKTFICVCTAERDCTFGGSRLREDRKYCFFFNYANLFDRKNHRIKSKTRRYDLSV